MGLTGKSPLGFILNRVSPIPALASYYGCARGSYGEGVYKPGEVSDAIDGSNNGETETAVSGRSIGIVTEQK